MRLLHEEELLGLYWANIVRQQRQLLQCSSFVGEEEDDDVGDDESVVEA